ncbi:MAG: shikimate dehydrogenase family protein [Acidimicrobiia bacterium]
MKFAIVGDPVAHSLSPRIHNAGFLELGIDAEYVHMQITDAEFRGVIDRLRSGDLDGVNITMPHKARAYSAVDSRSDDAYRTRAVNTIVSKGGQLVGHNTDIDGVRYAAKKTSLGEDTPALILGSGGAAAAAVVALEDSPLVVSSRDQSDAENLLRRCSAEGTTLPWGTPLQGALVVNATPLGMHGELLPDGLVERAGGLIDMTYGEGQTAAVRDAVNFGFPYADGIDMLVGQAVSAFDIFTGQDISPFVLDAAARGA